MSSVRCSERRTAEMKEKVMFQSVNVYSLGQCESQVAITSRLVMKRYHVSPNLDGVDDIIRSPFHRCVSLQRHLEACGPCRP